MWYHILPYFASHNNVIKESYFFQGGLSNIISKMSFQEREQILDKLENYVAVPTSNNAHGCIHWQWKLDKSGYPRMNITLKDKVPSTNLSVHRLAYFMCHPEHITRATGKHISHLCHQRTCINPNHLVMESNTLNSSRNRCQNTGICEGHKHRKQCLL